MTAHAVEVESLRALSPQATLGNEGGVVYAHMPHTQIQTPAGIETFEVVLCPCGLGGYVTRLLLDRAVAGKALNWQTAILIGRTWHTWSWNHISPSQPWIQIFAEHARLLR